MSIPEQYLCSKGESVRTKVSEKEKAEASKNPHPRDPIQGVPS